MNLATWLSQLLHVSLLAGEYWMTQMAGCLICSMWFAPWSWPPLIFDHTDSWSYDWPESQFQNRIDWEAWLAVSHPPHLTFQTRTSYTMATWKSLAWRTSQITHLIVQISWLSSEVVFWISTWGISGWRLLILADLGARSSICRRNLNIVASLNLRLWGCPSLKLNLFTCTS